MFLKIFAILIVLGVSIAGGCDYYGNYQAERFCARVPVGSGVGVLLAAEKAEGLAHYLVQDTGAYRYSFRGYMFSAGVCEFSVAHDRITAKRSYHFVLK